MEKEHEEVEEDREQALMAALKTERWTEVAEGELEKRRRA